MATSAFALTFADVEEEFGFAAVADAMAAIMIISRLPTDPEGGLADAITQLIHNDFIYFLFSLFIQVDVLWAYLEADIVTALDLILQKNNA